MEELYCVDPQWLCAMLAKVVTVRESNPFHKNGMHVAVLMLAIFPTKYYIFHCDLSELILVLSNRLHA